MALLVKLIIPESKLALQDAFPTTSSEIFCDLQGSPVMIQVMHVLRNRSGHPGGLISTKGSVWRHIEVHIHIYSSPA